MRGDPDHLTAHPEPHEVSPIGEVAERDHTTGAGCDPVPGVAALHPLRDPLAQVGEEGEERVTGAGRRSDVAVADDVGQDLGDPVGAEIARRAAGVDAPTRALPRDQVLEGVDRGRRRCQRRPRAQHRDPDRTGVVHVGMPAAHLLREQLARVGGAFGVVAGPAPFVDPALLVDHPVVRDVDVLARHVVAVDAPHRRRGVRGVVRRDRVVDDDLLDCVVVDLSTLPDRLICAPLRTRDDRRDRPIRYAGDPRGRGDLIIGEGPCRSERSELRDDDGSGAGRAAEAQHCAPGEAGGRPDLAIVRTLTRLTTRRAVAVRAFHAPPRVPAATLPRAEGSASPPRGADPRGRSSRLSPRRSSRH